MREVGREGCSGRRRPAVSGSNDDTNVTGRTSGRQRAGAEARVVSFSGSRRSSAIRSSPLSIPAGVFTPAVSVRARDRASPGEPHAGAAHRQDLRRAQRFAQRSRRRARRPSIVGRRRPRRTGLAQGCAADRLLAVLPDRRRAPRTTARKSSSSTTATALHVGIRAYAPAGTVRQNLADRDKISADDNIQLFLGTYNDSRQAMLFAVNPIGIQSDGS